MLDEPQQTYNLLLKTHTHMTLKLSWDCADLAMSRVPKHRHTYFGARCVNNFIFESEAKHSNTPCVIDVFPGRRPFSYQNGHNVSISALNQMLMNVAAVGAPWDLYGISEYIENMLYNIGTLSTNTTCFAVDIFTLNSTTATHKRKCWYCTYVDLSQTPCETVQYRSQCNTRRTSTWQHTKM